MSDMVYTLKPVKVCLDGDDCNVFDAYLVGYGRRGFCEQNSGGYEHPHFTLVARLTLTSWTISIESTSRSMMETNMVNYCLMATAWNI